MIISKISRIFNKSWMFSISLSSAFSNQTFSEKKKEMLNYDSSCLCVAGEHGQWQQGSAVLQPHPCVVSEENLHRSVLVSSMLESPISTLYQALRQVYGPVLLQVRHRHTGRISHKCEFAVGYVMRVVYVFCRMTNGVNRSTQSFSLCSRILRSGWALCSDTHIQRILGNGVIRRRMCRVSSHGWEISCRSNPWFSQLVFLYIYTPHTHGVCRYHDPSGWVQLLGWCQSLRTAEQRERQSSTLLWALRNGREGT